MQVGNESCGRWRASGGRMPDATSEARGLLLGLVALLSLLMPNSEGERVEGWQSVETETGSPTRQ